MSSSAQDAMYIAWTKSTTSAYLFYACLIVTPFGLLFNVIQIIVFSRKKFHSTTMGFFNIALALFDCNALVVLFCNYFSVGINSDLSLKTNASCVIMIYIVRCSVHFPSWIQVLITYDRFISVAYPNRFKFNKSKKKLTFIIIGIVIAILIVNSENLWFGIVEKTTVQNVTVTVITENVTFTNVITQTTVTRVCTNGNRELVLFRDMVGAVFRSVFPFIFMLIGNILLIKTFLASKRKTKVHGSSSSKSMSKEVQFAVTIFVMNIFFIIVYSPLAVTIILTGIFTYMPSWTTPTNMAAIGLAFNISVYIAFLNNTLPLFFNLKFNKIFRNEFMKMLYEMKIIDENSPTSITGNSVPGRLSSIPNGRLSSIHN